jgi:hypothetical protein
LKHCSPAIVKTVASAAAPQALGPQQETADELAVLDRRCWIWVAFNERTTYRVALSRDRRLEPARA